MTDEEVESLSKAVQKVINEMPEGTYFFGNELKELVVKVYPDAENVYVASILHTMRRKCKLSVRCVDRNDSLYVKRSVLDAA